MKKLILIFILASQFLIAAWAQAFVVRNIEIRGLQHLSPVTVENYLPIKRGDTLRSGNTAKIVRALYHTGFFSRITLARVGNTLVVIVAERPTIGQLSISGNSIIPTDKLTNVMKTLDIAEGRIYNEVVLDRIKQSLLNQYHQLGRYNAQVDITVLPMSRNRVAIKIVINEGLLAKIRQISIIGNHAFDEATLINQLGITRTGLFTFFTQSDRYGEAKMEESLEKLRNFYMDHGYLRFEVKSAQAEMTPDRRGVYITIVIDEGPAYTIESYDLTGDLIFSREEIDKYVLVHPGEPFSRQKVIDTQKSISKFLGSKGYMFANITLKPRVNDATHLVVLVFEVKPGRRVYVRHVTFSENNRTNDIVLRREVVQMEGAPVSTVKLEESKQRLSLLPYLKEANMSLNPVPDIDDQVDVNYQVKEDNSAQMSFKIGYSQAYGVIVAAGINQKNFLGTGSTLGLNVSASNYEKFAGFEYTDPYYTEDGISRTISASISRVDPKAIKNFNNGYALNQMELGVLYGIPVGQEIGAFSRILAGISYQNSLVLLDNSSRNKVSKQILSFINRHGRRFQELDLKLGFTRDSRDRAIFPTRGMLHSLFLDGYVPASRRSLTYYTLNYHGTWYQPITEQFILHSRANFGYGNGLHGPRDFPFFKNFYAGGIDSVRGYETFSLGPRDSNYQSYGGNVLMDASIGLIFPNYLSDNLRTTAFVDAGNVYSLLNNRQFGGQSTNSGPIRFSVGIEADWLTPFGPIRLSLAQPFRRAHDRRDTFQFALGANF